MKDAEEEAKRDKKWKEFNAKTEEIKRRLQEKFYGTGGQGVHGIGHTAEQSQMESSPGGISGLEEYESYGANGYQNAIDYTNELEIQEKIRKHEEKMSKAHYNRLKRLEEQRMTLQYQSEQHHNRVAFQETGDADKERETLERYYNRQVKSRKAIKQKNEVLDEKLTWKRQKD